MPASLIFFGLAPSGGGSYVSEGRQVQCRLSLLHHDDGNYPRPRAGTRNQTQYRIGMVMWSRCQGQCGFSFKGFFGMVYG